MSMLGRAAAKFEKAFIAQPEHVRSAVALAMYRAAPAIAQYQKDLAPLADDPEIAEAVWGVALAVAWQLVKNGRDGLALKQLAEMRERAPQTADFCINVGRLISGLLPGMGSPLQLTAVPPVLPPREGSE